MDLASIGIDQDRIDPLYVINLIAIGSMKNNLRSFNPLRKKLS